MIENLSKSDIKVARKWEYDKFVICSKKKKKKKNGRRCDPATDRYSDLAVLDDWNLLAVFSPADQADCQLQNGATWISRHLGYRSDAGTITNSVIGLRNRRILEGTTGSAHYAGHVEELGRIREFCGPVDYIVGSRNLSRTLDETLVT